MAYASAQSTGNWSGPKANGVYGIYVGDIAAADHDYLGRVEGVIRAVGARDIAIGAQLVPWAGLDTIRTHKPEVPSLLRKRKHRYK